MQINAGTLHGNMTLAFHSSDLYVPAGPVDVASVPDLACRPPIDEPGHTAGLYSEDCCSSSYSCWYLPWIKLFVYFILIHPMSTSRWIYQSVTLLRMFDWFECFDVCNTHEKKRQNGRPCPSIYLRRVSWALCVSRATLCFVLLWPKTCSSNLYS